MANSTIPKIIAFLVFLSFNSILNAQKLSDLETGLFKDIVSAVGLDEKESENLLSRVVKNRFQCLSAHATRDDYLVIYSRSMPKSLSKSKRAEIVSMKAANEILSLAAIQSSVVLKKLESFTYPEVLVDYARERLFSQVSGKILGLAERKSFFENENQYGIFVRLPREFVDLSAVQLITQSSTQSYYSIAVRRLAQKSLTDSKFEEAMKMLLESLKYGNDSKGLFVDLYKCFLGSFNKDESARLCLYLDKRFSDEIDFDQALNLAVLAENAKFSKQSNFWYNKAEQFFGLPPSPEMFLNLD
jgi:hypothetical protein